MFSGDLSYCIICLLPLIINGIWCIFRGSSCETDQGFSLRFSSPLARIYFRLFAFIFHWERDPKKPRYLLCDLIICRPRKAIFGESQIHSPLKLSGGVNWYRSHWCLEGWQMIKSHQRCRDKIVWRSHSFSGEWWRSLWWQGRESKLWWLGWPKLFNNY